MSDLIGKELGPFRILEQIGLGGMATVFKAYHPTMDRYVAVKVLPEQIGFDGELRQRFQQEAKVIALGQGKLLEDGKRAPFEVKVGDKVFVNKYGGTEIGIDDEEHLIIREDDILAIIG